MKKLIPVSLCAGLLAATQFMSLDAEPALPTDNAPLATVPVHAPQMPTAPGQAAFGAISEIVHLLQADSTTDWSKVNVEALRQHLIDMDAVVMRATVVQKPVPGGIDAHVTGSGSTVGSIQRLATNHAGMLNMTSEYRTSVEPLPDGVRMTVTAANPNDTRLVARIRGLGFTGLLTEGSHHQPHHLAMARGEMVHKH